MSLVLACPLLSSEEACTGDVMLLCYHYVNAQEGGPGEDVSGILLFLMGEKSCTQLVSIPRGNTVLVSRTPFLGR